MDLQMKQESSMLQNTFYANMVFSGLFTVIFLFATQSMANFMGISYGWMLTVLGLGFIPFIGLIAWALNSQPWNGRLVKTIIAMDASWVLLSYLYLLLAWSDLTVGGRWFVFLQAEVIFFFALFQYLGLRRLQA